MAAAWLLLLLSLTLSSITVTLGQPVLQENETEERSHLDEILQRAEGMIIRSIRKKIEEEDEEPSALQLEWLSKRQHPGKRFLEDLEKRQHPGKREEGDEMSFIESQKRQHPGKREEDSDGYMEMQKRQHPGRRSLLDHYWDSPSTQLVSMSELSKKQHPGKRTRGYSKRQHPGKREWDEELEDLEKRQHPGKRYLESEGLDYYPPCDIQDIFNCTKASLLLELLDNVNKGREEEKRQHPGRRSELEGDLIAQE
ncbi:thyrotropin releasing hormone [Rhinatrema bivittatum]|uniref:thyrotropin releasing hormone n=1 Tax=Rhinatrema bivittatum TaxID=194408 RepID=UPI00112CA193|nr:thyrotropin releasing hormone [Rhinatrema bivittatum]